MSFVHLHCHSHYSFDNGTASPEKLILRAKDCKMPALALTDYCNLYGIPEFCRAARDHGIKPILGAEVAVAGKSRHEKGNVHALTLLAANEEGWRNLMQLSSLGFLEGFHDRPAIDKELLQKYNAGIICLSGFRWGEIGCLLSDGENGCEKAKTVADWYRETFGDRYYLELRNHGVERQRTLFDQTVAIGKELGIPTVATNDIHYLDRADWKVHDLLLCIKNGSVVSDENRPKMDGSTHYFRTVEEMYAAFPNNRDAVERTLEMARRIEPEIFMNFYNGRHHPGFSLPNSRTADDHLRERCLAGLKKRYGNSPLADDAGRRLNSELAVIRKLCCANHFLIVWDVVRFAEENGILYTARGNAVGSLVCYALGISNACPLEDDLPFERFPDESHNVLPDIGMDFAHDRREEIINYVKEKYGKDCVAKIGEFPILSTKAAIPKAGRGLGRELSLIKSVQALVPHAYVASNMNVNKALEENKELFNRYENEPDVRELLDFASQIEGRSYQAEPHACALAIADGPLAEYVPLQTLPPDKHIVTQWDRHDIEAVGVLTLDFPGLRPLSVYAKTLSLTKETTGETVKPYTLPPDEHKRSS